MNQAPLWSHQMQFPAEDESVPRARHFVCQLLIDHRSLGLVEDVGLVVSELATNAIRHANTPFTVALERVDQSMRLTVTDGSPVPPVQLPTDLLNTGGRGLSMVDVVSSDWGVIRRGAEGKSVWASFALRAGTRNAARERGEGRGLRGVPERHPRDKAGDRAGHRRAGDATLRAATTGPCLRQDRVRSDARQSGAQKDHLA